MKQIIASGGGGFTQEGKSPLFDYYVLASANKQNPRIGFLPTAGGDDPGYCSYFRHAFSRFPCKPTVIKVLQPEKDLRSLIMRQDIIYVGGGNSKSMLGLWKEWGVDSFLKEAWEAGVVMAGISAGSVCWFEECLSDCYPEKLTKLKGLGFIKGSNVVHYESSKEKQEQFPEYIQKGELKAGYAVDNFTALHFYDDKLKRVVASTADTSAKFISKGDGENPVVEELPILDLNEEEYLNRFIINRPINK